MGSFFKEFIVCNIGFDALRFSVRLVYSAGITSRNKQTFKANEKRVNRYLQDKNFQINDALWRRYIKLLFNAMTERNLLKSEDNTPDKR